MSNKSFLKVGIAFVLLAAVLIFLGVNYVPRIFASSSAQGNFVVAGKQTRPDYIDEHYPRAIVIPRSNVSSGLIEQLPSVVTTAHNYYASQDWIEQHPSAVINLAGSDWIQRHP